VIETEDQETATITKKTVSKRGLGHMIEKSRNSYGVNS